MKLAAIASFNQVYISILSPKIMFKNVPLGPGR